MARIAAALILVLLLPPTADAEPEHRVSAKPIVRPAPIYPSNELRRGNQGWVDLSYVVSKDGEVVDPVVEASSGSRFFESKAVDAVKRFRYEPATVNGEPVQQCVTKVRISFAIEGSTDKVSRKFYSAYSRIDRLLKKQEIEEAEQRLETLFDTDGLTLGEISWLWALKARIASIKGDKAGEQIAVKRALGSSDKWLPEELYASLLKVHIAGEIDAGNYASAREAWKKLQTMDQPPSPAIESAMASIESFASGEQLFFKEGSIGQNPACESCEDNWQYQPLRRSIELADIDGKLDNIEIRCDWQHFVDEASAGKAWLIPESWGDCKVVLLGEPGTTFKLFEIPAG